jgi:hypothetical protein
MKLTQNTGWGGRWPQVHVVLRRYHDARTPLAKQTLSML